MWFPLTPRDLHSVVPAAVHRTDSVALMNLMKPGGFLRPGGRKGSRISAMAAGLAHDFLSFTKQIKGCRPMQKTIICLCTGFLACRSGQSQPVHHDEEGVLRFTTAVENGA